MKIDLIKAFKSIDWEFFQIIIHKIGFSRWLIHWVMACIYSINMLILINEKLPNFFRIYGGLKQDYSLSPLLFILVIDGLIRGIQVDRENGLVSRCQVIRTSRISHLIFVDDLLFSGKIR